MKYIEKIESFPIFVTNDYLQETKEFKDTKGAIDIRKSKKDRTHNGQKKNKRTNIDPQNATQKTKNQATRTPLKSGVSSWAPEG